MKSEYMIIDVTRDQSSTAIIEQLAKYKPKPGNVIALKGGCLDANEPFIYMPLLILNDPEIQPDGYLNLVKAIIRRMDVDEAIYGPDNVPVEIDDIDYLNIDIEEGRLTPSEAYTAYKTKELPDHYTGLLADDDDNEGEGWKECLRKKPDFTQWCSVATAYHEKSSRNTSPLLSAIQSLIAGSRDVEKNPRRIQGMCEMTRLDIYKAINDPQLPLVFPQGSVLATGQGSGFVGEDEEDVNELSVDIHVYSVENKTFVNAGGDLINADVIIKTVLEGKNSQSNPQN